MVVLGVKHVKTAVVGVTVTVGVRLIITFAVALATQLFAFVTITEYTPALIV